MVSWILKFIRKKVKAYRNEAEGIPKDFHGNEDHQKFGKLIKMLT